MPFRIALAALIAVTSVPAMVDTAYAGSSSHAGSSSRSETRYNLTNDDEVEVTSSRSKSRRAKRSSEASGEVTVRNRGKRSRRNPAATEEQAPMIANVEEVKTDLVTLVEVEADAIAKHIRSGEFEGDTGLLALYKLTGKAAAGMPLAPVEIKALSGLTAERDLAVIIEDTETRLTEVTGDAEMLNDIAAALGIPRPEGQPGAQSNLGASLAIEKTDGNG